MTTQSDQRSRDTMRLSKASQALSLGSSRGLGMLTTKDVELMAQHQDLDLLRVPAAKAKQSQLNHSAEREVDERPDHEALQTPGIDREQRG